MTSTTKMKQIIFKAYGSAEVLTITERPIPQPDQGEVLLKVEAAGVNYSDVLRRKNTYFMPTPLPFTLGTEAVGEIVQLGEGVAEGQLHIGQRALAILPSGGGYAEYVQASAQYCIPLPPSIDAKAATAIFVQGSTAHLMLHQTAPSLQGKTVLIHAASGGVGSILVQLAKLAGAKVIATSSSDQKLALAQTLGADITINYSHEDWPAQLINANGGNKVDLILEMVGGDIYTKSFDCLTTGGTMIVYGAASGQKGHMHSEHFVDEGLTLKGFNLAYYIQHHLDLWQASLGAMIQLIAEGSIRIHTTHSYPLSEAYQAHRDMEQRKTTGKVVLIP